MWVSETIVRMWFVKKVILELSQNIQENTTVRVSFLIKLQPSLFKKGSGTGVFCEFHEIFKSIFL